MLGLLRAGSDVPVDAHAVESGQAAVAPRDPATQSERPSCNAGPRWHPSTQGQQHKDESAHVGHQGGPPEAGLDARVHQGQLMHDSNHEKPPSKTHRQYGACWRQLFCSVHACRLEVTPPARSPRGHLQLHQLTLVDGRSTHKQSVLVGEHELHSAAWR